MLFEQNWNAVPGGTARSINRLATAVIDHGGVDVVGVTGGHRRPPTLDLPRSLTDRRSLGTPGRLLNQSWSLGVGPRLESVVVPDVVHAPAYLWPRTDATVVSTIHDLAFVRHPEWFTPNGVSYLTRFLDQVRDAAGPCLVPSSRTAADCVDLGIASERVRVIPWGVDRAVVDERMVGWIREHLELDEPPVVYVGTLEPRKNIATLAAAMKRLPHRRLVVVGPRGWGDVDPPEGAVVMGEVGEGELTALLHVAGVLAYPSLMEGFGLPVLEAMAHGTPVVTAQETASDDLAGNAGLSVEALDSESLAEAIEAILVDEDLARRLGRAGRARAAGYTWDRAASATIQAYEDAIDG